MITTTGETSHVDRFFVVNSYNAKKERCEPLLIHVYIYQSEPNIILRLANLTTQIRDLTTLSGLLPELKLLVMGHLSAKSLCRLAQVDRQFSALASDPLLWKRLFLRVFGEPPMCVLQYKRFRVE